MAATRDLAAPWTDEEVPLRTSDTDALPQKRHGQGRRTVLAGMVSLGCATAVGYAALSGTFDRQLAPKTSAAGLRDTSELAKTFMEDGKKYRMDCGDVFNLKKVVHNNLGNKGPDSGKEGIQWLAAEKRDGDYFRDVLIDAHATTDYTPFKAEWNGMNGHFGIVNMPTGQDVKLKLEFFDAKTKAPLTLRAIHFTFYDLDQAKPVKDFTDEELLNEGKGDTGREYIRAYGEHKHHVHLDPSSELIVKNFSDHRLYMSTHVGTTDDNPKEPNQLTQQQRNRAVAFSYKNVKTVDLVFGSTAGPSLRAFEFALTNIMDCKKVEEPVKEEKEEEEEEEPVKPSKSSFPTLVVCAGVAGVAGAGGIAAMVFATKQKAANVAKGAVP